MSDTWIERSYQVGSTAFEPGEFLTVCPAPDFPKSGVLLGALEEKAKTAFGPIFLQGTTDYMRAIGHALIKCADDVDREAKGEAEYGLR